MTTKRGVLACAITLAAALYSLYALFILTFLSHVDIPGLDFVKSLVLIAMVGRFLAIMVVFAIKRRIPVVLLLLFGVDFFVTTAVMGIHQFAGIPELPALAYSVDGAAITSFLVVIPACLVFLTSFEMAGSQKFGGVLLSVLLEIGLLYFMVGSLAQAPSPIQFNAFPAEMVVAAKYDIAAATIPQISDPFAFLSLAAIYSALLVYGGLPRADLGVPTRTRLVLPLLSSIVTLGGVFVASFSLREALVAFPVRVAIAVVPLSLSLAAIWLLSRRAASGKPAVVARKVLRETRA